ncbi:MAG: hypothetical protein V4805_11030 [Pseudomonadota bacterium]
MIGNLRGLRNARERLEQKSLQELQEKRHLHLLVLAQQEQLRVQRAEIALQQQQTLAALDQLANRQTIDSVALTATGPYLGRLRLQDQKLHLLCLKNQVLIALAEKAVERAQTAAYQALAKRLRIEEIIADWLRQRDLRRAAKEEEGVEEFVLSKYVPLRPQRADVPAAIGCKKKEVHATQ